MILIVLSLCCILLYIVVFKDGIIVSDSVLRLYKDFLTYWIVTKNYYYLVIEPFSNFDIEFAKLSLNGEEFMIKHRLDEEGAMESEKIEFDSLPDILNFDVKIKINGKEYNGEFDQI